MKTEKNLSSFGEITYSQTQPRKEISILAE